MAAAVMVLGLMTMAGAGAQTSDESESAPAPITGELGGFDGTAVGGVVDFQVLYPDVFVYRAQGGVLESTAQASGSGNAKGVAGALPIPLLYQGSALFPAADPITGTPIPEQFKQGYEKINFQKMPNQCRSEYPDIYGEGNDERYCGGPAQDDPALGFTAATVNGHSKSSGDPDDPMKTKVVSTSRGNDISIPSLQATIHNAWAQATSGVNAQGVPASESVVEMDGVAILGGLIQLNDLKSKAVAESDGTDAGTKTTTSFSLGSASVAGVPVLIGRDGVSVHDQALAKGESVQEATKQVSDALNAADIRIRLAPAPVTNKVGSQSFTSITGVEVVQQGETGRRSDSYYRFGYAAASISAVQSLSSGLGGESGGTSESGVSPYDSSSGSTTTDTDTFAGDGSEGSSFSDVTSDTGTATFDDTLTTDSSTGAFEGDAGAFAAEPVGGGAEPGAEGTPSMPSTGEEVAIDTGPVSDAVPPLPATLATLPSADVKNLASALLALAVVCAAVLPLRRLVR
ncbi:MAG: hypothetical protein AB1679_00680 [Actinomycetota bacterium]